MTTLPIERLARALSNCQRCPLFAHRHRMVIGTGTLPADILFLGEGPGRSENTSGIPFDGPSGKILDEMILRAQQVAGLSKLPTYYITNIVLCRACDDHVGQTRDPSGAEILCCGINVQTIIDNVQPRGVVFFGKLGRRYYGKDFENHTMLSNPYYLWITGGVGSPAFATNVTLLADLFTRLTEEE